MVRVESMKPQARSAWTSLNRTRSPTFTFNVAVFHDFIPEDNPQNAPVDAEYFYGNWSKATLLRPEGPQIHWLTDAQYDRTGLSPDNAEPLAGARPVPLKAGEWNKLKLTLAGDEVTIVVNGEEVARRKLELYPLHLGALHHSQSIAAKILDLAAKLETARRPYSRCIPRALVAVADGQGRDAGRWCDVPRARPSPRRATSRAPGAAVEARRRFSSARAARQQSSAHGDTGRAHNRRGSAHRCRSGGSA